MSEDSKQGLGGEPQSGGPSAGHWPEGATPGGGGADGQPPSGQTPNESLHRPVPPSPRGTSSPERSPGAPVAPPLEPGTPHGPDGPGAGDWLGRLILPAYESKGWLKFLGVLLIISGGFLALTIVGLLFAWLPIWIGVLLWQAGDRAGVAYGRRDPLMLEQYIQKLKTVIIIIGVVAAVKIVLAIMAIGMVFALGGMAALMEHVHY